jgi:hypothetical protein
MKFSLLHLLLFFILLVLLFGDITKVYAILYDIKNFFKTKFK